jgi:all-trans-8'-apo-beta-carotenal 15,15'-oxygenase
MSAAAATKKPRRLHPARMGTKVSHYWSDLTREHGYEPLKLEGDIPSELSGTLYRTGPALTQRFGRPYSHVFEGDGAICAVRLGAGKPEGAVRLLRGDGFVAEERAGRPLYQTAVSWPRQVANGLLGRSKNTGNTNVMAWHGNLYALMENARPIAFDRELETVGETSFGGVIRGAFSAHPHPVATRRTTYNVGLRYGRKTHVAVYSLPWEGPARCLTELPLDHPVLLHDFMATEKHAVMLVSPLRLVLHRAILSIGDFTDLFRWTPSAGTEVIVVPIDEPERVRRFRTDAFFQIHFCGGHEEPDATAVDIMKYPDSSALDVNVADIDEPPQTGEVTRIRIPHGAERIEHERLCETTLEFGQHDPRVAGSAHRHLFGLTVDESHHFGLVHVDLESGVEDIYRFPEGEFCSEALFAPKGPEASEGEGYLLTIVYRSSSRTSHLAVFDAQHLSDGPLSRAHFDHHIPSGFHGTWVGAPGAGAA